MARPAALELAPANVKRVVIGVGESLVRERVESYRF